MDRREPVLLVGAGARLDSVHQRLTHSAEESVTVERVSSAPDALDWLDDHAGPVCLVCDVEVDWLSVTERASGATSTAPVVLVASDGEIDSACRAAALAERVVVAEPDDVPGAVQRGVERCRQARERQRAVDQLTALFESNPDPVVEYEFADGAPVIRAVNRAFVETFGYDREAVAGRSMNDVLVPGEKADEAAALDERVRDGGRVTAEVRRETADGEREFRFKNVAVETAVDGPDGYAIYTDVTDQNARERQLQRQNERLNEFTSVVSHDLRGPMEVIKNRIEIARLSEDEEQLDKALEALDRMDGLLRELLQLARQGEDVSETGPVPLDSTAESAWAHVATGEATLDVAADPTLVADYGRLTQLLENLYINAVEHNDADSALTITVGVTEDGEGIYVADNGKGIPPEHRSDVFESGYTTGADGTGYGLTIVRQVAHAHDWEIALTDAAGGGARFEFRGVEFTDR